MKDGFPVDSVYRLASAVALSVAVLAGSVAAQTGGTRQGTAEEYSKRSQAVILGTEPQDSGINEKLDKIAAQLQSILRRLERLEVQSGGGSKDEKAKSLLTSLDIITKGEQRVESLRKQLFDVMDKETSLRARIAQIDVEARPENIDRNVAFSGSLRPEELRDAKRKSLDAEKKSTIQALEDIQTVRTGLESSLQKAESLVTKLRQKFDKDIDAALGEN